MTKTADVNTERGAVPGIDGSCLNGVHTCYTEKACFLLFSRLCYTYDSVKSLLARFKKIPLQIMLDGRHVYTATI